jgi:rapamycin-insensitive companion of mTOR
MDSKEILQLYRKQGIYIFVAHMVEKQPSSDRNDRDGNNMQEIIEAIKFIRRWIVVDAASFPKLLANSLVALAEGGEEQIKKAAIETLRKLTVRNPEVAADCGGMKILFEAIIDPNFEDSFESITYSLLLLLNNPKSRAKLGRHLDFASVFAVFTNKQIPTSSKSESKSSKSGNDRAYLKSFDSKLSQAKKIIIILLMDWKGLIYLANEKYALKSLFHVLKQDIKPAIKSAIFEIIEELLKIGMRDSDFKHKHMQVRNLLMYFEIMLLWLLIDCGLLQVLLELSGLEDPDINEPA